MPKWRLLVCCVTARSAPECESNGIAPSLATPLERHSKLSGQQAEPANSNSLPAILPRARVQRVSGDLTSSSTSGSDIVVVERSSTAGVSRGSKTVRFDDEGGANAGRRTPDDFYDELQRGQAVGETQSSDRTPPERPARRGQRRTQQQSEDYAVPPTAAELQRQRDTDYSVPPTAAELHVQRDTDYSVPPTVPPLMMHRQRDTDYSVPPTVPPSKQIQRDTDYSVPPSMMQRQTDTDYSVPPTVPPSKQIQRDTDYSVQQQQQPDYQNLPEVKSVDFPDVGNSEEPHAITKEFLNDLLARDECRESLQDGDSRSLLSNTDSIDSQDIVFRPECQLNMNRPEALMELQKLEGNFCERCDRLYRHISMRWKSADVLVGTLRHLRPLLKEIAELLQLLANFHHGALNNARLDSCPDRALSKKIWKHLRVFERNCDEFRTAVDSLDRLRWKAEAVAAACATPATDHLGFAVSSARDLQIQQRALSTAVRANSTLLFTDERSATVEKVIPIETEAYVRMRPTKSASSSTPSQQRSLCEFFANKLQPGVVVYAAMCEDLLAALAEEQPPAVLAALTKNAVTKGYQMSRLVAVLLEGLPEETRLRQTLDSLLTRFGNELRDVLRASKSLVATKVDSEPTSAAGEQLTIGVKASLRTLDELAAVVSPGTVV